jgi:hypothetical protein
MDDSLRIRLLSVDEWPLVEPVVRAVFNDAMPETPAQAGFLAALDGDNLAAFLQVETLFRFFNLYVAPEYRGGDLALG